MMRSMARVLDSFPAAHWGGSAPVYPWHLWFDGRVWELEQGKDFVTSRHTFRNTASCAARRRQLVIETVLPRGENTVIIRAERYGPR
jgi:hypothetical protein